MKMPELQNILEQYGKQYKEKHNLPIYVKKTLNAIEKCSRIRITRRYM